MATTEAMRLDYIWMRRPPSMRDTSRMRRVAIVVPLKEGAEKDAERLLSRGPPFDPAEAGFTRHSVYLTSNEAVFVFEGAEVEWALDDLAGDVFRPMLHAAAREWEKIEDGRPRLGREAYFWEEHDQAEHSESGS
jgi:hypothetical protein